MYAFSSRTVSQIRTFSRDLCMPVSVGSSSVSRSNGANRGSDVIIIYCASEVVFQEKRSIVMFERKNNC